MNDRKLLILEFVIVTTDSRIALEVGERVTRGVVAKRAPQLLATVATSVI